MDRTRKMSKDSLVIIGPDFMRTDRFDIALAWIKNGHQCAVFQDGNFVGPLAFGGDVTSNEVLEGLGKNMPYGTVYRCRMAGGYDYYLNTPDWITFGFEHPADMVLDVDCHTYGNFTVFEADGSIRVYRGYVNNEDGRVLAAERVICGNCAEQSMADLFFMSEVSLYFNFMKKSSMEIDCNYIDEVKARISKELQINWSVGA